MASKFKDKCITGVLPNVEYKKPSNKKKNFQKMPNVDLVTKAEVVNYDRHGFSRPNLWHRPIAKVKLW